MDPWVLDGFLRRETGLVVLGQELVDQGKSLLGDLGRDQQLPIENTLLGLGDNLLIVVAEIRGFAC